MVFDCSCLIQMSKTGKKRKKREEKGQYLLLCSYQSKFFKSASKPKEKSRSASSTTSISRDECRSRFWALRCASTRDGVPTTTSGFSIKIGLFKHNRNINHTIQNYTGLERITGGSDRFVPSPEVMQNHFIPTNVAMSRQTDLCADRSALPEMSATRTSLEQYAVNCLIMVWTCWPSSLVGTRIRALTSCSRTLWRQQA